MNEMKGFPELVESIHHKLIEKAKITLATTNLSVCEIAYQVGLEQPQSVNKLFKSKTSVPPLISAHRVNKVSSNR
jgi:transcriptional regulator GlxA family with amidase domain